MTLPVVQFEGVSKRYAHKNVLENISFTVFPGEIVALLGVNGAGKTTTMKLILGQEEPHSGHVYLYGYKPTNPTARQQVGSTPQTVEFPPGLRVHEVVSFVAAHYAAPHALQKIEEAFGLTAFLQAKAANLSGGQKRRLALALAFVGNPQTIFLDEPTTGLDVEARQLLWQMIRQEAKQGKTIFLTTHYLEEIEQLASRVIFLQNHKIRIDGTVSDLKKQTAASARVRVSFTLQEPYAFARFKYVESHEQQGLQYTLFTKNSDDLIRELVQAHIAFRNLNVVHDNLESAFLALSKGEEVSC